MIAGFSRLAMHRLDRYQVACGQLDWSELDHSELDHSELDHSELDHSWLDQERGPLDRRKPTRLLRATAVDHLEYACLANRFTAPTADSLLTKELHNLANLVPLRAHMTDDGDDVFLMLVGLESAVGR